jgi:hypothetical protein
VSRDLNPSAVVAGYLIAPLKIRCLVMFDIAPLSWFMSLSFSVAAWVTIGFAVRALI